MVRHFDSVVVGAGHGGTQVASVLGADGQSVALVGAEPSLPYERPPLSKAYLAGEATEDQLHLRTAGYWENSGVELILGARAMSLDADAHRVQLNNGDALSYGSLVWAAGGSARTLSIPGHDSSGVQSLRTLGDARALRKRTKVASRAVVIGGGFIGLEAAAKLRSFGLEVTVVEALPRLLTRATGATVSTYLADLHVRNGVRLITSGGVEEILAEDGVARGVRLLGGEVIEADIVIVGVGLIPEVSVLADAGALVDNGVVVDGFLRTSLPDVYAIGDCANFPFVHGALARGRLESVQNATEQGKAVAATLTGTPTEYHAVPWFWSHQYELKLQTAGVLTGYDREVVRRGEDPDRFSVLYLEGDRLLALDAVNSTKDYVQARQLIQRRARLDLALAADVKSPLAAAEAVQAEDTSRADR